LKYYCGIILNKKYQLADWRIRPLPLEMLVYAQSDTHYLLYIYDQIRKDILTQHHGDVGGIIAVLQSSQRTCLKRYEKDYFYPQGYLSILHRKATNTLTMEQTLILELLWNWRDLMARREDESVSFILSNSELIRLGMKCPKTEIEFYECGPFSEFLLQNKSVVSHLIRLIAQELNLLGTATGSATGTGTSTSIEMVSLNDLEVTSSELFEMRHRAGSSNASLEEVFLDDFALTSSAVITHSFKTVDSMKPIDVYSAPDGRYGQFQRLQGCNTIKEIQPTIRNIVMASPGAALYLASTPITHAVDEKQHQQQQQFELHSETEWKQVSVPDSSSTNLLSPFTDLSSSFLYSSFLMHNGEVVLSHLNDLGTLEAVSHLISRLSLLHRFISTPFRTSALSLSSLRESIPTRSLPNSSSTISHFLLSLPQALSPPTTLPPPPL
jgi:hypothetical protein